MGENVDKFSDFVFSERQSNNNAPVGPSPGIILATGSSAFLASLLINLAVGQITNSNRLTTISTTTAPPTTTMKTTTLATITMTTSSAPLSNISSKGCPDGWVDGRSVNLGCVWAEIREDPLLIGQDYLGDDMGYSLGGGEGVNQVRPYSS